MNIAELVRLTEQNQLQHEHALLEMLDHLRAIDPEVAAQAIRVFDDKTSAAGWLASSVRSLGGATPLQALVEGRRADVLRVLGQIAHGVYG